MNVTETAKAYIKAQLGLPDNPADWTYDQRIAYIRGLSTYIANNPDSFSAEQVATANASLGRNYSSLDETGLIASTGAFVSAFGDEVLEGVESVAGIGEGILSTASMLRYLIPLTVLLLVGVFVWHYYKTGKLTT
jgi:hypothetical protein